MRIKRMAIGAAVLAGLTGATALGTLSAAAADSAAPVPAVTEQGHAFYTDDQIDDAWQAATAAIPYPLPSGVTYPSTAPRFFHPADGKKHLFEDALPAQIAAKYWRCGWIRDAVQSPSASARIQAATNAAKYASLPKVSENLDVSSFLSSIRDYATSHGLSTPQAELVADCDILN